MGEKKDLVEQRAHNLKQIQELGYESYPHQYPTTHTIAELVEKYSDVSAETLDEVPISTQTAGRIVNLRGHGKAGFADFLGAGARIQVYVREDRVGKKNRNFEKKK